MFSDAKYDCSIMPMKRHKKCWPKVVKSKMSESEFFNVRLTCDSHFRTFCLINSSAIRRLADVLTIIKEHEFIISNCAMIEIDSDICSKLSENGETIRTGVVVALELVACDAVRRLQKLLGDILKC